MSKIAMIVTGGSVELLLGVFAMLALSVVFTVVIVIRKFKRKKASKKA